MGQARSRPVAPKDRRTASIYIFDAICPTDGKGAALVLLGCDTPPKNLRLAEITKQVAPGAHAVLLFDQAGGDGLNATPPGGQPD
jgi:hypothetical protein